MPELLYLCTTFLAKWDFFVILVATRILHPEFFCALQCMVLRCTNKKTKQNTTTVPHFASLGSAAELKIAYTQKLLCHKSLMTLQTTRNITSVVTPNRAQQSSKCWQLFLKSMVCESLHGTLHFQLRSNSLKVFFLMMCLRRCVLETNLADSASKILGLLGPG